MYRYVHPFLLLRHTIYGLRRSLKLMAYFYFKELCTEINRTASPRVFASKWKNSVIFSYLTPQRPLPRRLTSITLQTEPIILLRLIAEPILSPACNLRGLSPILVPPPLSVAPRAVTPSIVDCIGCVELSNRGISKDTTY